MESKKFTESVDNLFAETRRLAAEGLKIVYGFLERNGGLFEQDDDDDHIWLSEECFVVQIKYEGTKVLVYDSYGSEHRLEFMDDMDVIEIAYRLNNI